MTLHNTVARLGALAALAVGGSAWAQPSGLPELCQWYPGVPECSCNINPYNVVCGSGGWPNVPDLRDGVTPPDPQHIYIHVPKTSNNPYSATCWSSSIDRYNYAYWEVVHGWADGDENLGYWWGSKWFFVVYSDNTLSEGYAHSQGFWELYQEPDMRTCGRPPLPHQLP
ncbi:hypothetical protein DFR29_107186 [Tahibacter aquaticus]|uniref:Peptidase inhibitor family I36 n=1 Tax=Tahibacter aquaticus TaxID=520092 RepID=A0A4R6YWI0_9GAMM|nr:hypothetical protein [Tahibacter aquaticus]TDR43178.1 hypothetical protein DFR29_107186 [Tahibacter aquaticus]